MLRILDSAAKLFTAQGFEQTTVQEIAKLGQLSTGAVYRRFPDKTSILYTILSGYSTSRLAEFDKLMANLDPGSLTIATAMDFYVSVIVSAYRHDSKFIALFERCAVTDPAVRKMVTENSQHIITGYVALLRRIGASGDRLEEVMSEIHHIIRGAIVIRLLPLGTESSEGNFGLEREFEASLKLMARAAILNV